MALTILGTHVALGSLLSGCYSIVTKFNQLHQSYKFMPITFTSIVASCNLIRFTLNQVDSALAKNFQSTGKWSEELVEQFDGIKIGCVGTLSSLENHVTDLLNAAGSDVLLVSHKITKADKLKALYNESDMKELFEQLKIYLTLLNTILSNIQSNNQQSLMSKQDLMIDMMRNQQDILRNMFRARDSLRITDHELASDATSTRTSRTRKSVLTASELDSIIKQTAIYQRHTRMSSHYASLSISEEKSMVEPASGPRAESTIIETTLKSTSVPIYRQEADAPSFSFDEQVPMTTAVAPSHVSTPLYDSNITFVDSKVSMISSPVKTTTALSSYSRHDRHCPSVISRPRPEDLKSSTEACVIPDPNYAKLCTEDLVPDAASIGNMPACNGSGTLSSTLVAAPLSREQVTEAIGIRHDFLSGMLTRCNRNSVCRSWRLDRPRQVDELRPLSKEQSVSAIALSPEGHTLFFASTDGKIRLWHKFAGGYLVDGGWTT